MVNSKQLMKQKLAAAKASYDSDTSSVASAPTKHGETLRAEPSSDELDSFLGQEPKNYRTIVSKTSLSTIPSEDSLPPQPEPGQEFRSQMSQTLQAIRKANSSNVHVPNPAPTQDTWEREWSSSAHSSAASLSLQQDAPSMHQVALTGRTDAQSQANLKALRDLARSRSILAANAPEVLVDIPVSPQEPKSPIKPSKVSPPHSDDQPVSEDEPRSPIASRHSAQPKGPNSKKERRTSSSSSSHTPGVFKDDKHKSKFQTELKLTIQESRHRRSSSSSITTPRGHTSSHKTEKLKSPPPPTTPKPSHDPKVDPFLDLLNKLNIERVFFDPELDVLNRFCLEYVELCKSTFKRSFFGTRSKDHFQRVYDAMKNATEDAQTPVVDESPPVTLPVLHYGLFLGHFRSSSQRINDPAVPLPHFTHGKKLTPERFKAMIEQIFNRRAFLGQSMGVSSTSLKDVL